MPDITRDLELIDQVADEVLRAKLQKYLSARDEIESHPDFLATVEALPEDEAWIGQIFTIPIIWLERPRREAQLSDAMARMRQKLGIPSPSEEVS